MTQITAPDAWLVTRQGLTQDLSYRGQRDVTYATSQQRAVRQSWAGLAQVQAGSSPASPGGGKYPISGANIGMENFQQSGFINVF